MATAEDQGAHTRELTVEHCSTSSRRDDRDPLVRGRVPAAVHARPRPRHRPTSARARRPSPSARARRAAAGRHDDLHLPRPRRGAGDGRAARPDVRRDPRQGRQGLCGGKGGSMHLTDVSVGALGSFAIVGAHLPIAAGLALRRAATRGTDDVCLCFFGDGATNIGAFHEALNLAAIWKLPVVFVCENNLYGEYSPLARDDAGRASSPTAPTRYAMRRRARRRQRRACAVRERSAEAAARARGGRGADADRGADLPPQGPLAHRPGDLPARGRARARGWSATRSRCSSAPLERRAASPAERARASVRRAAEAERRGGTGDGRSTWPDPEPEPRASRTCTHERGHLPRGDQPRRSPTRSRRTTTCSCSARTSPPPAASSRPPRACSSASARDRVLDTPISEQAIIGTRASAPRSAGLRPVAEIMFADFAGVCFDQIANQLAKYRYMTGGQVARAGDDPDGQRRRRRLRAPSTRRPVENWFLERARA